ncbi:syntaxin-7-like [Stegostoma tigrinum]|uniref:syntaxin-7-like n=1 Tax=Stegostoma tigrinum TaxID=3053191 RepID=UPI00202B4CD3|nr:syntaxin-7-like [Stegostoma tigrinum]XP_048386510.1 syntaxin-7-like [Stegostoma tigrinum]XP_048386511.1 syntaxin-7-like [Stegostoma tigrinum]XP_048386512.1 syntaxin-7-like [Stegostoma tigrinum]XP_048386513.1 syntaxin-7-like [Stegostoma tigrinum]XP_048386514.1 syntaxin-7-like [Stegostoma tigrinum]
MISNRNDGHLEETSSSLEAQKLAHVISSNIHKIAQYSAEIQKTLSYFGKPEDNIELRHQLQQKQQLVNHLAKETEKNLKEFGLIKSLTDQRQRKIMKDRLVAEFTTALTNFQRIQREAAEKEKEFVARVRAGSRLSQGLPDNESDGKLLPSGRQNQVQDEIEDGITVEDLELIKERESAIRQLESDILDINEIFKDLGMMIHEQGDLVDSIEANVETAEVHVQQANQQLSRAAEYQRKSRKKMFILIMLLVIIAVIVGIIIWVSVKK